MLAFFLSTGCSDDDDSAAADERRETTTTAETTTTLSPREQEEQAVIAAHHAASQARRDSAAPPAPNPDLPSLGQTHTGEMLRYWTDTVRAFQYNRFAIRYPQGSQYREEVEAVTFNQVDGQQIAVLDLCVVDDGERFSLATGRVQTSGTFTVEATETMRKEAGAWKVEKLEENGDAQEGVVGCAVD